MRLQSQDFRGQGNFRQHLVRIFGLVTEPRNESAHPITIMQSPMAIFEEHYRVVAVDEQRLVVRGVVTGKVLTIVNPHPEIPISLSDYPPGQLIALTDPAAGRPN